MNLNNLITQLKSLEGYVHHRLRATDHKGLVKCYTVWMRRNGEIRDNEVRILVLNEGKSEEEAIVYSTKHIVQSVTFKDQIEQKISKYMSSHPEVEIITIDSVNEQRQVAFLSLYIYDDAAGKSRKQEIMAFIKEDNLVVRVIE